MLRMCSNCRVKLLSNYIELSKSLAVGVYGDCLIQSSKKIEKDHEILVKNDDSRDYKLCYERCPTVLQLGHRSPHYVKDEMLLELIQRRFTRMIPGLKNVKYEDRFRELNLWTLEDRRVWADLIDITAIS